VVVDQPVDAGVRETLSRQGEEQTFGADRLVENLVAQLVDERLQLTSQPAAGDQRRADGLIPLPHLVEQDRVLVAQSVLLAGDPVGGRGRRPRQRRGTLLSTASGSTIDRR
jgi:hypothetical protein